MCHYVLCSIASVYIYSGVGRHDLNSGLWSSPLNYLDILLAYFLLTRWRVDCYFVNYFRAVKECVRVLADACWEALYMCVYIYIYIYKFYISREIDN